MRYLYCYVMQLTGFQNIFTKQTFNCYYFEEVTEGKNDRELIKFANIISVQEIWGIIIYMY